MEECQRLMILSVIRYIGHDGIVAQLLFGIAHPCGRRPITFPLLQRRACTVPENSARHRQVGLYVHDRVRVGGGVHDPSNAD